MTDRAQKIFDELTANLCDTDDPLKVAEGWAQQVAKTQADNERLRANLQLILTGASTEHMGFEVRIINHAVSPEHYDALAELAWPKRRCH